MTSDKIVTTELTDLENKKDITENKIEKLPVVNSVNGCWFNYF